MISLFLLSAFGASTYTIGKVLLAYAPPFFLISVRLLVAGIIFLGYYRWYTGHHWPSLSRYDYWLLFQITIFAFYLAFTLEFWALQDMTSAKTAFLYSLSPVIAAVFSYFMFNERMSLMKAVGLIISIIASVPILMENAPQEGSTWFYFSWPEIRILGAITAFTYGWVIIRTAIKNRLIPLTFLNGFGMFVGGIFSLATAYLVEVLGHTNSAWISPWIPVTQAVPFLWWSLLLVFFGNIICYALYGYVLQRYTATLLTFGELTTPFFAALYGWLFLGEHVPWYYFISMVLLLLGIYIVYNEERRQGYIEFPPPTSG
jgi:drug/metabolite transporter (DMT)-like permease